jgi:ribose/xylose/arabinose/galactoside ABC-type transport system permease subunit
MSVPAGWLKKLAPLLGLVCVWTLFAALRPRTFATVDNFALILTQTAVVGTAALGMTMIIIAGGIDLSVGSALALCTVVIAQLLSKWGLPPAAAGLASVLLGAAVGMVIGLLVTVGRLIPFIVTLGLLAILRGTAKGLAPKARVDAPDTWLNELLNPFGEHNVFVPPGVWVMLALALLVSGVLRYTRFGRHVFAVGSSEQTARLCGVAVDRTKLLVYVYAGALNGVAGVLLFSTMTMGMATSASGYELSIIAAVVIGGASLAGGEGTVLGSLVGALLMTVVANGCTKVDWLPPWVQEIVTGVIIVLAVALDRLRHRRAA